MAGNPEGAVDGDTGDALSAEVVTAFELMVLAGELDADGEFLYDFYIADGDPSASSCSASCLMVYVDEAEGFLAEEYEEVPEPVSPGARAPDGDDACDVVSCASEPKDQDYPESDAESPRGAAGSEGGDDAADGGASFDDADDEDGELMPSDSWDPFGRFQRYQAASHPHPRLPASHEALVRSYLRTHDHGAPGGDDMMEP